MMRPDEVKQALLDFGWTATERRRIREVLVALDQSAECRRAADEYDAVREQLASGGTVAEPDGGWDALADRIAGRRRGAGRAARWPRVVTIAAMLMMAVWMGRLTVVESQQPGAPSGEAAPSGLSFTAREVAERLAAFREIEGVFGGRVGWVMTSDEAAELGLAALPGEPPATPMVLRLAIVEGGRVKSTADFTIVPGQDAIVSVPFGDGRTIRYHVATTGAGPRELTVWAEVRQPQRVDQLEAALAASLNIQPGQTLNAGQMVTPSGRLGLCVSLGRVSASSGNGA